MYLLAQFRKTRAYPTLVQIFSLPLEMTFDLVEDTVTKHLGSILASVSAGQISGMIALIENEDGRGNSRNAVAVSCATRTIGPEQMTMVIHSSAVCGILECLVGHPIRSGL